MIRLIIDIQEEDQETAALIKESACHEECTQLERQYAGALSSALQLIMEGVDQHED